MDKYRLFDIIFDKAFSLYGLSVIRKTCFIVTLFLFSCFNNIAQSLNDTIHIPEVEIVAIEKFPVAANSVTEIDSFTLSQIRNMNLAELLSQYSTVFIKSTGRGSLSTASFRGTDASHTKIYWNGLNLNSPMLGQMDLSLIPATFLDHLSLYHGGSSLVKASGALGGIISIENQPAWDRDNSFSLSSEMASFGTYEASGNLYLNRNNLISHSRVFINHSDNDYPFYNTNVLPHEEQRLKNSDYSKYGYLQEFYYRIQSNDFLSIKLWLQHSDRNLPSPLSRELAETKEYQSDGNIRSVITWKHTGKLWDLELSSGITSDRINYTSEDLQQENISMDSRSQEKSLFNSFDGTLHINSKTSARVQVLYNYYDVKINELIHSQGYDAIRSEISLMTGIDRYFGKRLNGWFLMRTDRVDEDFIPLMPSLGFALKLLPEKNIFLKANLSRNYNMPSLNDLYWIPGGNPNLRPEENYTADLALDVQSKNDFILIHSLLTAYVSGINDWILWKPTQYGYWAPENVAQVFSRGLEFNIKTIKEIQAAKMFFQGNYNLSRTTGDGKQLIYIPLHAFNMHAGVLFKGFQFNYSLNYTGKRYTRTDNEEESPESILNPYFLNDISASKEFSLDKAAVKLRFAVYNLFNKDYQVILSRPMPGRNYSANVTLSF